MRKKGKNIRDHIILIRVNRTEKELAEKLAKETGENTSEFFRRLLRESRTNSLYTLNMKLAEKHKCILKEYKKMLRQIKGNKTI